jgi:hypothetical protein
MTKGCKDAAKTRREYRIRVLRREFSAAVMSQDYKTADRLWIQLDNLELGKKARLEVKQ